MKSYSFVSEAINPVVKGAAHGAVGGTIRGVIGGSFINMRV